MQHYKSHGSELPNEATYGEYREHLLSITLEETTTFTSSSRADLLSLCATVVTKSTDIMHGTRSSENGKAAGRDYPQIWVLVAVVCIVIVTCIISSCSVLGSSPTPGAKQTPKSTTKPSPTPSLKSGPRLKLLVSPTSFNARTNCSYNKSSGWICVALLSSDQSAQSSLNWHASGGITGTTFNPPNGTLEPGRNTQVSIFIPNTICPASITFSFAGPANTFPVSWSCAAPNLRASPSSLSGSDGCSSYNRYRGWTCYVMLSSPQDVQGGLRWYASGGLNGTTFDPPNGTLYPGQEVVVTISIPVTGSTCPVTTDFIFSGSNTSTVSWSCS